MLTSTAALQCAFMFDCRFFQARGQSFGLWTVEDWGMCMGWNSKTYYSDSSRYLLGYTAPICTHREHALVDHFVDAGILFGDTLAPNLFDWHHKEVGMCFWSRGRWMFFLCLVSTMLC
jgi:hypothetical protein